MLSKNRPVPDSANQPKAQPLPPPTDSATGKTPSPRLWRHHDFRALWVGDTISQVGTQLSVFVLPVLAIQTLGAQEAQLGMLTACETAAFLLVGLPAGAWVDRWRKRRVLIVNDLLRAVLFASVPVAWWFDVLSLAQLFVVAALVGVCTVFFEVAYQSYLPHLLDSDQLVPGNARLQASQSVAQAAGPAVAGGLLRYASAPLIIFLNALSFLGSAVFLARIRSCEERQTRSGRRRLRTEVAEGLRFVLTHPLLRRITACTSLNNFFASASSALFALYLLRDLDLSTSTLGLVYSASAVGGIAGAALSGRVTRLLGEGRAIPVAALLSVPGSALTPLAAHVTATWRPLLLIAGGFLSFAAVIIYNITQVSYRQRVTPPDLLGRMNASVRFLVWGTQPLGALAGGALGATLGILPTMWLITAGGFVAALPVVLSPLSRMRDLPRTDSEPIH
ncbi:MAG: hypothetical protein QG671_880 [Actinomycetota bacterium]|nr:hypothetical protein [Actinomycetota bacterium]